MTQGTIKLTGMVRKLIDRSVLQQPQLVQIALHEADHLYDEVRIPNTHGWEAGIPVEVTIRPI
jgi:hypothetical protein